MKDKYDFSKGTRNHEPGKIRITIRLDEDLIDGHCCPNNSRRLESACSLVALFRRGAK